MSKKGSIFFPEEEKNIFDLKRYLKDLEDGAFKDRFNLGVRETAGGEWALHNPTNEPHVLFGGATGSGKSISGQFTMLTWMLANSEDTIMFVCDKQKGAADYKEIMKIDQVYPVLYSDEGVHRLIDMVYSEAMARQEIFGKVGAENLPSYERITGKRMTRVIVMFEEFHAIVQFLDFEKKFKEEGTTANKLNKIMKIGRSYNILVGAATQKMTSADISPSLAQSFVLKVMGKTSSTEAQYMIGDSRPSMLTGSQKGRMFTEYGAHQFPYIGAEIQKALIKRYVKPLKAISGYLDDKLIKDYLSGSTPIEIYKLKKPNELAFGIENYEPPLVLRTLHERVGDAVEVFDMATNPYNLCFIATKDNGRTIAVSHTINKKLGSRAVINLSKAVREHDCDFGIIYTNDEVVSASIHKLAAERMIKIYERDDLRTFAAQIEKNRYEDESDLIYRELRASSKDDEGFESKNFIEEADFFDDLMTGKVSTNKIKGFGQLSESKSEKTQKEKKEDKVDSIETPKQENKKKSNKALDLLKQLESISTTNDNNEDDEVEIEEFKLIERKEEPQKIEKLEAMKKVFGKRRRSSGFGGFKI